MVGRDGRSGEPVVGLTHAERWNSSSARDAPSVPVCSGERRQRSWVAMHLSIPVLWLLRCGECEEASGEGRNFDAGMQSGAVQLLASLPCREALLLYEDADRLLDGHIEFSWCFGSGSCCPCELRRSEREVGVPDREGGVPADHLGLHRPCYRRPQLHHPRGLGEETPDRPLLPIRTRRSHEPRQRTASCAPRC